jgi:hypothetical protein
MRIVFWSSSDRSFLQGQAYAAIGIVGQGLLVEDENGDVVVVPAETTLRAPVAG